MEGTHVREVKWQERKEQARARLSTVRGTNPLLPHLIQSERSTSVLSITMQPLAVGSTS
jgi:hypothetical protein